MLGATRHQSFLGNLFCIAKLPVSLIVLSDLAIISEAMFEVTDSHRYRGHRRYSFVASDVNELQELRARQRTFHGAYTRTAIGALGYASVILRLFDPKFHQIGLLFAILSALLFVIAYLRSRHSTHDFADRHKDWSKIDKCIKTKGQESGRIFGRPFITAGWSVVEVTLVVALAEIALLALIIKHPIAT